jgi:hypothetical protein
MHLWAVKSRMQSLIMQKVLFLSISEAIRGAAALIHEQG